MASTRGAFIITFGLIAIRAEDLIIRGVSARADAPVGIRPELRSILLAIAIGMIEHKEEEVGLSAAGAPTAVGR